MIEQKRKGQEQVEAEKNSELVIRHWHSSSSSWPFKTWPPPSSVDLVLASTHMHTCTHTCARTHTHSTPSVSTPQACHALSHLQVLEVTVPSSQRTLSHYPLTWVTSGHPSSVSLNAVFSGKI